MNLFEASFYGPIIYEGEIIQIVWYVRRRIIELSIGNEKILFVKLVFWLRETYKTYFKFLLGSNKA